MRCEHHIFILSIIIYTYVWVWHLWKTLYQPRRVFPVWREENNRERNYREECMYQLFIRDIWQRADDNWWYPNAKIMITITACHAETGVDFPFNLIGVWNIHEFSGLTGGVDGLTTLISCLILAVCYTWNSIYTLMSVSKDLEESGARYELEQLCVTTSPQDPFDYSSLLIMCFVVSRLSYQGMSQ
jgi:hypothetical protein